MRAALLGLSLLFGTLADARADTLDDQIRALMEQEGVPGLALAVVQDGKIARLGAYGFGDVEWQARTTDNTRFEIASISKMFTGAAVRILIEEGQLNPEDPVRKYLPETPQAWSDMRVRHLITMSSGLPEDFGEGPIPYSADVIGPPDDRSMLEAFAALKMQAPIGQEFHYSGPNYAMLGMIVRKVSGKPLPQFIGERIFAPAGMTQSTYIDNSAVVPERAAGYRRSGGTLARGWFLGQYLHARPDVGVLTTARDLANWIIALESGKVLKDPGPLWAGANSDTGRPLDYAYGWITDTFLGHHRLCHAGGYRTGFHTYLSRYPDDNLSVVVLSNCDFSNVRQFALLVTLNYLGDRIINPMIESTKPDRDPVRTAMLIAAMKGVAGGTLDESVFAPGAFDPEGPAEAGGFLKSVTGWGYGGSARLPAPGLRIHGQTATDFLTLKLDAERGEYHFVTLYCDSAGKVVYVEGTT